MNLVNKRISKLIYIFPLIFSFICNSAIFPTPCYSQSFIELPAPGQLVTLSAPFKPVLLRGITVHPQNPYQFDFIFSAGEQDLKAEQLKGQSEKLIKYFLASLTVPEKDLWVNLSPFEKEHIMPDPLSRTDFGRDLMAQDYILKALAASLTYPEKQLGKSFWDQVYKKAFDKYGTTDIKINAFNKIWILADSAKVYEHADNAFVVEGKLKVLLEEDFLSYQHATLRSKELRDSLKPHTQQSQDSNEAGMELSAQVLREVIIPQIEQEVNEGKNFAQLRQIYYALILATWFKKKLKDGLIGQVYANKNKVHAIDIRDKGMRQRIYTQYLKAYRKGVYNYIKDEVPTGNVRSIPRKYFSGGITPAITASGMPLDQAMVIVTGKKRLNEILPKKERFFLNKGRISSHQTVDRALIAHEERLPWPFPVLNGRGHTTPEWLESFVAASVILEKLTQSAGEEVGMDEIIPAFTEGLNDVFVNHYGTNMKEQDKINLIQGLRFRGLIAIREDEADHKLFVSLKEDPLVIAIWADDVEYLKKELQQALQNGGKSFFTLMEKCSKVVALWPRFPKEAMDPVLQAVALLDPSEKIKMTDHILNRVPEARDVLTQHILLMLNYAEGKKEFLAKYAHNLIGRTIWLATPEYQILKGGLGRVMKYHGEDLSDLGADARYIQPKFRWIRDKKGNLQDYESALLPIKIKDEVKINKIFTTFVARKAQQGGYYTQEVKFEAWVGKNEQGMPVYSFRDISPPGQELLTVLYEEDASPDARTKADAKEINVFMAKASLELIRYVELEKMQKARDENRLYRSPVIDPNDAQMLSLNAWINIFYGKKEKILRDEETSDQEIEDTYEIFRRALIAGTTHTYPNRPGAAFSSFVDAIDFLRKNGVLDEMMWLFIRKVKDHEGRDVYIVDLTSSGLRSSDAPKAVSAIQANDMNALDPTINLTGIANGDKLSYTAEYFQRALREIGIDKNYLDVSKEEGARALAKVKSDLGLDPLKMVVSYSGRGVWEKFDLPDWLLEGAVSVGIQFVVAINEQPSEFSKQLSQRLRVLEQRLKNEGYRDGGEHADKGRFVLHVGFDIDEQRKLLAATDLQVQISARHTEAAGASEANISTVFGIQMGPAYWEGILNKIGLHRNKRNRTGSIFVPTDGSPQAVLEALKEANKEFEEHGLSDFQWNGLQTAPVYSSIHTAACYSRFWNQAIEKPKKDRPKPRPAGEVSLRGVNLKYVDANGSIQRMGNNFTISNQADLFLQVEVGRKTVSIVNGVEGVIPVSAIHASLVSEYGQRFPLELTQKFDAPDTIAMFVVLPADLPLPYSGRIEVSSGMWTQSEPIQINVADNAALANATTDLRKPGGVLLDPANMKMNIHKDLGNKEFSFSPIDFDDRNFQGFYWKTLDFAPIAPSAAYELLGLVK